MRELTKTLWLIATLIAVNASAQTSITIAWDAPTHTNLSHRVFLTPSNATNILQSTTIPTGQFRHTFTNISAGTWRANVVAVSTNNVGAVPIESAPATILIPVPATPVNVRLTSAVNVTVQFISE